MSIARALLGAVLCALLATPLKARETDGRWEAVAAGVAAIASEEALPGYGLALLDRGRPVLMTSTWPAGAPFRWGSITKTFTALAALKLAETGRLDLDAPVLPQLGAGASSWLHNPWEATTPLTTRHLLELTAGVSDLFAAEWDDNVPRRVEVALRRNPRTLLWPPGLQHGYSNYPPGVTEQLLATLTGEPFENYLRQAVLIPLAMASATLEPAPGLPPGFAKDGKTPLPYWHMTFRGFGALNAPLEELVRLPQLLLNSGRLDGREVFSASTLAQLYAPGTTPATRAGLEVGYGAGMYGWIAHGQRFWGHGGDADGYRSRYAVLPDAARGYVLAINADRADALRRLKRYVEAELVADLEAPPKPPVASVDLEPYLGDYYPASTRFDVAGWQAGNARGASLVEEDGTLIFERGRRRVRLLAVGEGRFRRAEDPVVTVVFFGDQEGVRYLQGELGSYVSRDRCPGFLPRCLR